MLRDSSSNTPRLFQVSFLHTVGVMMVSPNFIVISRSNLFSTNGFPMTNSSVLLSFSFMKLLTIHTLIQWRNFACLCPPPPHPLKMCHLLVPPPLSVPPFTSTLVKFFGFPNCPTLKRRFCAPLRLRKFLC